jgi:Methyltransferase domain
MPSLKGIKRRVRRALSPSPIDRFMCEVHGWTSYEQLEFLTDQVKTLPDEALIVEVGVWHGRSALALAEACRGTSKHVYAVDPWRSYGSEVDGAGYDGQSIVTNSGLNSFEEVFETFKRHIKTFKLDAYLTPVRGTGVEFASKWNLGTAAFVFVDASHTYEGVTGDLNAWAPLSRIICGDDWDFTGGGTDRSVERAVRSFLANHSEWRLTLPAPNTWVIER